MSKNYTINIKNLQKIIKNEILKDAVKIEELIFKMEIYLISIYKMAMYYTPYMQKKKVNIIKINQYIIIHYQICLL